MNLSDLLTAAYDELNYASSPATAVTTRLTRFLNEGVRAIIMEPQIARLEDSDLPFTFATTAGTARYTVPDAVAVVKHISDRTNDRVLTPMSLSEYRLIEPDPASHSGTPERYVPIGRVAVAVQPSDASAIFFKSTSASDTQNGFIEGIRTGGYPARGGVALTGATAAQVASSFNDFIEITDLFLASAAVGTVTLHEDSGTGTELARIPPAATRTHYYGFYLWPTPAAAVTYYVDYRRAVVDMTQTSDEPPIPTGVHPMLIAYAVMRECEKTGNDVLLARAAQRYARYLQNLKYQVGTMDDDIPVVGRHARSERRRFYDRATFPIA